MPIRPSAFLLKLLILWVFFGLAASWWDSLELAWLLTGVALGLLLMVDLAIAFLRKKLIAERTLPGRFALGVPGEVKLRVRQLGKGKRYFEVYDGIPSDALCEHFPWHGTVREKSYLEIQYPVTLTARGETFFEKIHLLERSPLRLWNRYYQTGADEQTKVYPNYQPVLRYALLAMAHRQEHTGIVRKNRAGLSRDFHQLRDYQMGDSLAQIDWKASSKRQSLISRDFQEQRDQSVILMVDCGRRMRVFDGELSQFDHCLNAMLLVSYIALRQGDQIGMLNFGGHERWLPPVKGSHQMTTILNHLYDYETSPFPSDFSEAAERVLKNQQRRSLVIVLTNLRGEDGNELSEPLKLLRQKHVVVLASLREQSIDFLLEKEEFADSDEALSYLGAESYAAERAAALRGLSSQGIVTLDETAQNFPTALANCYLDSRESI